MVTHHPIKVWRFNAGMTQLVLSNRVGTTKSHISEIERWKKTPSIRLAREIAKQTGMSLDDILKENPHAEAKDNAG